MGRPTQPRKQPHRSNSPGLPFRGIVVGESYKERPQLKRPRRSRRLKFVDCLILGRSFISSVMPRQMELKCVISACVTASMEPRLRDRGMKPRCVPSSPLSTASMEPLLRARGMQLDHGRPARRSHHGRACTVSVCVGNYAHGLSTAERPWNGHGEGRERRAAQAASMEPRLGGRGNSWAGKYLNVGRLGSGFRAGGGGCAARGRWP